MTKSKANFQFMPWTPEGKAERQAERETWARKADEADQQRRADEAEARLGAPITRRELLHALETVRNRAGCNVGDHWDAIEIIFRALINEIE